MKITMMNLVQVNENSNFRTMLVKQFLSMLDQNKNFEDALIAVSIGVQMNSMTVQSSKKPDCKKKRRYKQVSLQRFHLHAQPKPRPT